MAGAFVTAFSSLTMSRLGWREVPWCFTGGHVRYRMDKYVCVIGGIVVSSLVADAEAQRRVPGQPDAKQGIQISLNVGGQMYRSSEPGKCTHAPTAAIYKIVSELWSVQQSSNGRWVALSLWKPKDGSGDMVTLSVRNGGSSHEVNTVRGSGPMSGSGKVTLEKAGNGGTFTVDAKAENGAAISGTIRCDAFAPHIAAGGQ